MYSLGIDYSVTRTAQRSQWPALCMHVQAGLYDGREVLLMKILSGQTRQKFSYRCCMFRASWQQGAAPPRVDSGIQNDILAHADRITRAASGTGHFQSHWKSCGHGPECLEGEKLERSDPLVPNVTFSGFSDLVTLVSAPWPAQSGSTCSSFWPVAGGQHEPHPASHGLGHSPHFISSCRYFVISHHHN